MENGILKIKHAGKKVCHKLAATVGPLSLFLAAILAITPFQSALSAVAPSLGSAQSFAVLGSSTVTNTGSTIVTGNLGVDPGSAVTGFPPGVLVGGTIYAADAVALQAQNDSLAAYNVLGSEACNTTYSVPTDIGGLTLVPGVYCFLSSAQLTGTVTLDAGGDPAAVWVFKIASTLTTADNSSVALINGAQQCNAFWRVGSSATLGTGTNFIGNILAFTSITLTSNSTLAGSALAQNGAVTLDSNTVGIAACGVQQLTPTLNKAFNPALIKAGGSSTLTITLKNPNTKATSLTAPLTDTFPTGLTIAGNNASTTCGGTLTAVSGASTVSITGSSIPSLGSCTVTVPVTAALGDSYINSLAIGSLQTSAGNNAAPAAATLTVSTQASVLPTLVKAFSPNTINAGGNSTLTITLDNSSDTTTTLTAPFIDKLPSGVIVDGNVSTTCGGTVTKTASQITLSTGSLIPADGSCTVIIPVSAAVAGSYINSLPVGALQTNKGNSAAPVVATLTVLPVNTSPTLTKSFSPDSITVGDTTTLTIDLNNREDTTSHLTAPLTDNLPKGLVIAGKASTTCDGAVTAVLGSSTVALTEGKIPENGSCKVQVAVGANETGTFENTLPISSLQTSTGKNSSSTKALLTVTKVITSPPSLTKTFNPTKINLGGSSTLTLTLKNPSSKVSTLTAPLTDTFPQGLVISGGATTTCCGGKVTALLGSSVLTLSDGSIPAHSSCKVTVPVTGNGKGCYNNALRAGSLQTSTGNNAQMVQAALTINCGGYSSNFKQ